MITATIASQSGHYYDSVTGEPRYAVIGKNGNERPTRITDAKANKWYPSVTLILKLIDKPGLRQYFRKQMYDAAFTTPRTPKMTDEEHFEECCHWADEHAELARSSGKELHKAIEDYIRGQRSLIWFEHITNIEAKLSSLGIDLTQGNSEHSFACDLGYGGKTDYVCKDPEVILDFKNKKVIEEKKLSYDEHLMQLAAYSRGLGMPDARCLNVFVGVEDKKVVCLEYAQEDLQKAWGMFTTLLTFWQLKTGYFPNEKISTQAS
jgi:hypothetical protein